MADSLIVNSAGLAQGDEFNSFTNPYLTFHFDKVSCMKSFWYAHVSFCFFVFLFGLSAFATRLVFKWTHAFFGRCYVISMLWATATSLLIHNSGLPPATLISFLFVLGGMTVAWMIIKIHQHQTQRAALDAVQEDIASGNYSKDAKLSALVEAKKGQLAANRTFVQRFASWKTAHGVLMFVSFMNIAGRIFASNLSGDFTCHTYPVYKPIDTPEYRGASEGVALLPTRDPDYERLPWAAVGGWQTWGWIMFLGPAVAALAFAAVWTFIAARRQSKSVDNVEEA